jgi:hypothetical protein
MIARRPIDMALIGMKIIQIGGGSSTTTAAAVSGSGGGRVLRHVSLNERKWGFTIVA